MQDIDLALVIFAPDVSNQAHMKKERLKYLSNNKYARFTHLIGS